MSHFHYQYPRVYDEDANEFIVRPPEEGRSDKALKSGGFDSHFVVIRESMGYQAVDSVQNNDLFELVVKERGQVLPVCRLYFTKLDDE